jgi:3-dehydroquinate synthase
MSESEIIFSTDINRSLNQLLNGLKYSKLVLIVDENTKKHCLPLIQETANNAIIIEIKSGEEEKNLQTCTRIWEAMTHANLDRHALVVNLGGGVIGDMGGFCAATYKRGVRFIQIPTTLLSQVDASVGGKLGIDFMGYKNHVGVFALPLAVLIEPAFLNTLAYEELKSGYAEVIKHCLIADKSKWNQILVIPFDQNNWLSIAEHSVLIKSQVTKTDPFETGLRKILNFGHTVGHAVESYFLPISDKKLLHGHAIAIGMIAEAYISFQKGFISKENLNSIEQYILLIYGKVELFSFDIEKILPYALQDKKNENNLINASLLQEIGKANYNIEISLKEIKSSLEYYSSL